MQRTLKATQIGTGKTFDRLKTKPTIKNHNEILWGKKIHSNVPNAVKVFWPDNNVLILSKNIYSYFYWTVKVTSFYLFSANIYAASFAVRQPSERIPGKDFHCK